MPWTSQEQGSPLGGEHPGRLMEAGVFSSQEALVAVALPIIFSVFPELSSKR